MEITRVHDEFHVMMRGGRTSFMNVFASKMNNLSGNEEFSVDVLIPKETDMTEFHAAVNAAMMKKFQKVIKPKYDLLKDGDEKRNADGEPIDGYPGHWYLSAKTRKKPRVIDGLKNDIVDPFSFSSGDYANVLVGVYGYDHRGNKGVSCELLTIQKTKDGERLGGGMSKKTALNLFGEETIDDDMRF